MSDSRRRPKAETPEQRPRAGGGTAEGRPNARQTDTACYEHVEQPVLVTMEEVVDRENMLAAYRRVVRNKGAPGVDGVTVEDFAPESVRRLKGSLRETFRQGRGRNLDHVLQDLRPVLLGWTAYYRKSEVRRPFEQLDQWMRRKLRAILWRQWKRPWTRAKALSRRGLPWQRAWNSATNGRGPWWNAGASHMNQAVTTRHLRQHGLVSLLEELQRLQASN